MPAKSKRQQMAMGAALSAKRGKIPAGALKGSAKQMFENMNEKQLKDFAGTPRKGLPMRVGKKKKSGSLAAALKAAI